MDEREQRFVIQFLSLQEQGARKFTPTCGELSELSPRLFLPRSDGFIASGKAIHPAKVETELDDHSQSSGTFARSSSLNIRSLWQRISRIT
jgi:hypothetical protein